MARSMRDVVQLAMSAYDSGRAVLIESTNQEPLHGQEEWEQRRESRWTCCRCTELTAMNLMPETPANFLTQRDRLFCVA